MNKFVVLARVLLKETFATAFSGKKNASRKRSSFASQAATGVLIIILAGFMGYMGYVAGSSIGQVAVGRTFFQVLFVAIAGLTFFMAIPATLSSFFAASDLDTLLSMPFTSGQIVAAKSVAALISSYPFALMLSAVPLAGWAIATQADLSFWVAIVVVAVFVPLMPFTYAAIFSVGLATAFKGLRNRDAVTTLSTVISLGVCVAVFALQTPGSDVSQADAFAQLSDRFGGILTAFPAYQFAVDAFASGSLVSLALFAVISIGVFALFLALARPFYLRAATALSTGSRRTKAVHIDREAAVDAPAPSAIKTLAGCEIKRTVRTRAIALNSVLYPFVFTAIIVGPLAVNLSKSVQEFNGADAIGSGVSLDMVGGIALGAAVLLCALTSITNTLGQTIITREGSNWEYMKTIPVPLEDQINAKLVMGSLVTFAIGLICLLVVMVPLLGAGVSPVFIVLGLCIIAALSYAVAALGAFLNARNPVVDWGDDGDATPKVLHAGFSMLACFAAALPFGLITLGVSFILGKMALIAVSAWVVLAFVASCVGGRMLVKAAARRIAAFEG